MKSITLSKDITDYKDIMRSLQNWAALGYDYCFLTLPSHPHKQGIIKLQSYSIFFLNGQLLDKGKIAENLTRIIIW